MDLFKKTKRQPKSLQDAIDITRKRAPGVLKILLNPNLKAVCQRKAVEPREWLDVQAHFPPGTVGATKFTDGYMVVMDHGTVEFLTQKSAFHEYWFHGDHLRNRFTVRQLPNVWHKKSLASGEKDLTGKGFSVWMATFTKDPLPYTISIRAIQKKWYPPAGFSCLPKFIRKQIPKDLQYWKIKDQKKSHSVRDDLAVQIHKHLVKIDFNPIKFSKFDDPAPPAQKKIPKPKVPVPPLVSLPSSSVKGKIFKTLCYDPPSDLVFVWELGPGSHHCQNCQWLADNSPFTLENLLTFPLEGKTFCGDKCGCTLKVVFPDGISYRLIPSKNPELYNNDFMAHWFSEKAGAQLQHPIASLPYSVYRVFVQKMEKALFVGLWVDVKHMTLIDKAFMLLAAEPLIRDVLVAYVQACLESYNASGVGFKEGLCLKPEASEALGEQVDRIAIRLLNEGQVKEVQNQWSFISRFCIDSIASAFLAPVARFAFQSLVSATSAIKDFTDIPALEKLLKTAMSSTTDFRAAQLEKRIALEKRAVSSSVAQLKLWSFQTGDVVLKLFNKFMLFWKDCVLIFLPGTAVKNMADNTFKAMNEMVNSFVEGHPFWAFWSSKQVSLLDVPEEVAQSAWERSAFSDVIGSAEGVLGRGRGFWNVLRETLYHYMYSMPEQAARGSVWAGKLKAYEAELIKQGTNAEDFVAFREANKMAIEEVNRIFFDYSKRFAAEIPLEKIAPFEFFNVRNFNYWLKDFSRYPWKLTVITSLWNFWHERRGDNVGYSILDKIPTILIPGTYFNPFSYMSASGFLKVFAMSKGKPKWFQARQAHLRWQLNNLQHIPSSGPIAEYAAEQKFRWVRVSVEFLNAFLGLNPVLKRVLAKVHLANNFQGDMFPQGPLVRTLSHGQFTWLWGRTKEPGPMALHQIYGYMEEEGLKRDHATAVKIWRSWRAQKEAVGFLTGMFLTKSWNNIAKKHKFIIEKCQ